MTTRIVKLEIAPEFCKEFENVFIKHKNQIGSFQGCLGVKLVKEINESGVFFTISQWEDEQSINNYRDSALFGTIWPVVKPWFSNKAMAWSTIDM